MSRATSLWYSTVQHSNEQMQSNANPTTFKKNWKINSFLILSSQNGGRDPKLQWKVPSSLAQITIKALFSLNDHKQVCHKNISFAALSLWLHWEELRPFLHSRVFKFFTSSFDTLFLFRRSSCPWECTYLEKLPVAHGEGRSFCLTWTLQDSKGIFLALHESSEGWLENYQIYKKTTSKMKTYGLMLQQLFHHQKLFISHSVIHVFCYWKKKDF